MKFSATFATIFIAASQAAIIPYKSLQLTFNSYSSELLNRPLSVPNGNGPVGWFPNETQLFVGYQLPDGRIRVGGPDTWLTLDSKGQLAVLSAQVTGPTNFDVDDNNNLKFQNSDEFTLALEQGSKENYVVYGPTYKVPTNAVNAQATKVTVRYLK